MSNCTVSSACTSSLNRNEEWKRCCADAMGFEWVDCFDDDINDEHDDIGHRNTLQLTNLLDDGDVFEGDGPFGDQEIQTTWRGENHDAWEQNALRIQADLTRMARWIQSKKQEYVGLDMKDEEAGLIQSTVTSFAATTAGELETLRNMIQSRLQGTANNNNNLSNHRAGIVQILLEQLQEHVTRPFGLLQKQRVRVAVQLWQNPLQCKLYVAPRRLSKDSMFDDDDDDEDQPTDQRFIPMRSYQESCNSDEDFISKYANKRITSIPSAPPAFLAKLSEVRGERIENKRSSTRQATDVEEISLGNAPDADTTQMAQKSIPQFQPRSRERQENQAAMYNQHLEEELRTESVQLSTVLMASNELDSVQQMETRMVEITTLIGQFSNLVQEQQEQVIQVHESAVETKENMDKGQDNLIDAAERTKKSKNYKAYIILAMSAILMFFQILRN